MKLISKSKRHLVIAENGKIKKQVRFKAMEPAWLRWTMVAFVFVQMVTLFINSCRSILNEGISTLALMDFFLAPIVAVAIIWMVSRYFQQIKLLKEVEVARKH